REARTGCYVRVYNTHFPLNERARLRAARRVTVEIATGDPDDAVLLAGDFNAGPDAPSRRLLDAAGLRSSAALAGEDSRVPTYQFYGSRLKSLDGVLAGGGWRVRSHRILDRKPGNTFPSDHFGVLADLVLRGE